MQIDLSKRFWQWGALVLLAIMWGSSFILMKKGLESFSNWQVAAYRVFVSFLILLPFAVKKLKLLKGPFFWPLLIVGVLGNCVPAYLFTKAQTGIESSLAGMLNSLVPLWTLIIGVTFFMMRTKWINVLGVLIGLGGTTGLLFADGAGSLNINFGFGIYAIVATVLYAITVNIIKRYLHELDAMTLTSLAFVFVGPPTGVHLFSTDFISILSNDDGAMLSLLCITILGVVGTGLALVIFNMLIKKTTALFATTVTYLIPIVAIFWGFADKENITWLHITCMGIIMGGVYLVNRPAGN